MAKYFDQTKQQNNANEFYYYFNNYGASLECICGMLGNITRESTLNPAIKQGISSNLGWGLIQWTPATILTNWCKQYRYNWYDGFAQCERIKCEGEGTQGAVGYWLPTKDYPYKWSEFIALTKVEEATKAYLYERERAGVEALDIRLKYANDWYNYFTGSPITPIPPTPPTPYVKKMPIYMMLRRF